MSKRTPTNKGYIWQLPTVKPDSLEEFNNWFQSVFKFTYEKNYKCWYLHHILTLSAKQYPRRMCAEKKMLAKEMPKSEVTHFVKQISDALDIKRPSYSQGKYARSFLLENSRAIELLTVWSRYTDSSDDFTPQLEKEHMHIVSRRNKDAKENYPAVAHKLAYLNSPNYLISNFDLDRHYDASNISQTELLKMALKAHSENRVIWKCDKYRFYAAGVTLQNVPSELRRAMTPRKNGFLEIDLKSAHIAIYAGLFNITEIGDLLRTRKDPYVTPLNNTENYKWTRTQIKNVCNIMLYGGGINIQRIQFIQDTETYEKAKAEFSCNNHAYAASLIPDSAKNAHKEFMQTLLYERLCDIQKLIQQLDQDAFGYSIPPGVDKGHYVAASWEKKLLAPIYDRAMSEDTDISIVLDQHDGVTILADPKEHKTIFIELKTEVEDLAKANNIFTTLEIKNS